MDAVKIMPKKNKVNNLGANFGKLLLDAAKLCFAALVLGTIIKGDIPSSTLLIGGIVASSVCSVAGLVLISFLEEK